jgi:DNA-nicking Smr family endonuclease
MGNKVEKSDKDADRIFIDYMKSNPSVPREKPSLSKRTKGKDSVQSLDLHGMNTDAALAAAERFLSSVRASGVKRAVIITGKGSHSPGIRSPLRDAVGEYLHANALKMKTDIIEREGSFELCIKTW